MAKRFTLLSFVLSLPLLASPLSGKVFPLGSPGGTPLFTFKAIDEVSGPIKKRLSDFTGPDGKVAVAETLIVENNRFKSYAVEQNQLGEKYRVEATGTEVVFFKGDKEATRESLVANFVVAPLLIDYIREHVAEIQKGGALKIRFAVLDRFETVGFQLSRDDSSNSKTLVVKMRASSPFVRLKVSPIFIHLDLATSRLKEVAGRTLPKLRTPGGWKDLDADILYGVAP